jgi:hypothetical protein
MNEAAKKADGGFLGAWLASRGGKLVRVGMSIGIISTGALTATGGGHMPPLIGASIMFVAVAFCIAGMAFSLGDFPLQSVVALIALPPALWVFFMGLPFVAQTNPTLAWGAAALGLVPLVARGDEPSKA